MPPLLLLYALSFIKAGLTPDHAHQAYVSMLATGPGCHIPDCLHVLRLKSTTSKCCCSFTLISEIIHVARCRVQELANSKRDLCTEVLAVMHSKATACSLSASHSGPLRRCLMTLTSSSCMLDKQAENVQSKQCVCLPGFAFAPSYAEAPEQHKRCCCSGPLSVNKASSMPSAANEDALHRSRFMYWGADGHACLLGQNLQLIIVCMLSK